MGGRLPGDRILVGAAPIPEPDRDWLAAAERLPIESVWQGGHLLPPSRADVATFLGGAYGAKPAAMLDRIAPAGTPEEVAARLQAYVDAGVRHFIISPAAADNTLEVVTLAAREVLPRLSVPARAA